MTVLFVLLTFAVFLAIDYWAHRRQPVPVATTSVAAEPETFRLEPVWVGGYQVPDGLHYHRGHTWARPAATDTAVVGLDDFARRLIGPATRVALPKPGEWVRSGDGAARLGLDGRDVDLVAPVDGVVTEINPLLEKDPGLATSDPYGRGWLFKVHTGELHRNLRNLFSGSLAHRFVEDSKEKLQLELMALSGTVLADGGEPAADFARHLTDDDWRRLTREFLLA
jgi:glycine cleavage system H lipoate-binding protein